MKLIVDSCKVVLSERGANVDYVGGSLWLRPELAKGLKNGPYPALSFDVRLRSVRVGDRSYTVVFIDSLDSSSK